MPLSDSISSLLADIGTAAQKFPTAAVGGAVDIGNMILGGYANIGDLVQGKPVSRSIGEGLVKKPVGGTEQLNEMFGMKPSSGLTEDSVAAIFSIVNPAAAITKAMILPAVLLKSANMTKMAEAALAKGKPAGEVFTHTGIYKDAADGELKAVLDDSIARLKTTTAPPRDEGFNWSPGIVRDGPGAFLLSVGPTQKFSARKTTTLDNVLDHPELFKAMPELKEVNVAAGNFGELGSHSPGSNTIKLGIRDKEEDMLSTLLHETQHAIQAKSGFAQGGNPNMFFADKAKFDAAGAAGLKELVANIDVDVLATKNSNKLLDILAAAEKKAFNNYLNIAGEKEARVVQEMRASGNYSQLPLEMPAGSTGKLISEPTNGHKVDNDPLVRAVLKYFQP